VDDTCDCWKLNPLHGLGYTSAHETAASLIKQGWRQKQCGKCGYYTLWVKGG
jgi:hypothetical protein